MEIQEIQEALVEFSPLARRAKEKALSTSEVQNQMLVFLQMVLGYDFNEDIVLRELSLLPERPDKIDFNQKVKFVMTALPSETSIGNEEIQSAIDFALAVPTNVVMLTNGVKICFYAVDLWEKNWEVDILVEIDLLQNTPEEMAPPLWPLAKKDCGRKIWVNISN